MRVTRDETRRDFHPSGYEHEFEPRCVMAKHRHAVRERLRLERMVDHLLVVADVAVGIVTARLRLVSAHSIARGALLRANAVLSRGEALRADVHERRRDAGELGDRCVLGRIVGAVPAIDVEKDRAKQTAGA
jgi:hypothetical protein